MQNESKNTRVPSLLDMCFLAIGSAICPIFLQAIDDAWRVIEFKDFVYEIEKILKISQFWKTLHPCFQTKTDAVRVLSLSTDLYEQWKQDTELLNKERFQKPNTIGRVALSEKSWITTHVDHTLCRESRLTVDEFDALVSGKLMGITRFDQQDKNIWNIRMNSFVHPGVWFEIDYDAKSDTFLSKIDPKTQLHLLKGRMHAAAASCLVIRSDGFKFHVDDILNPCVWAEVDIPVNARLNVPTRFQLQKRKRKA